MAQMRLHTSTCTCSVVCVAVALALTQPVVHVQVLLGWSASHAHCPGLQHALQLC